MGRFDDPLRPQSPLGGTHGWDDWDPSRSRSGEGGQARPLPDQALRDQALRDQALRDQALRDIALPRDPALEQAAPLAMHRAVTGGPGGLSPAAQALLARIASADYLTVTHDLREPGFVEVYDKQIVPQWSAPFGRVLLSLFLTLPRTSGAQVLDVGCGTGYPTLELARFLGQDCDVAGIDVWDEAIHLARRKAADEWLRNVSFVAGDIAESGLPEGTFDTVTCNLGLASFADRGAALDAIRRLLRPGGQLLLTTPLQSAMREFLDAYYLTLRDLKLEGPLRDLVQLISARPNIEAVRQMLEQAGFAVQRTISDSFALRFPNPRAFLSSLVIQTTYLPSWRAVLPDLTIRRLVYNEVERRLRAAIPAGGDLAMSVPLLCVLATRS
jgi:arsenite methyltransferase